MHCLEILRQYGSKPDNIKAHTALFSKGEKKKGEKQAENLYEKRLNLNENIAISS